MINEELKQRKKDMKNAMTRAHEIRKEAAAKWNCNVSEILFNICLEIAWAETKENKMVELKGTEKQVAWAKKLIEKQIAELKTVMSNAVKQAETGEFMFTKTPAGWLDHLKKFNEKTIKEFISDVSNEAVVIIEDSGNKTPFYFEKLAKEWEAFKK